MKRDSLLGRLLSVMSDIHGLEEHYREQVDVSEELDLLDYALNSIKKVYEKQVVR